MKIEKLREMAPEALTSLEREQRERIFKLRFQHAMGQLVASKQIPGDTAECGVRFGKSTFFLLKAIDDPSRSHHIFDSFAGLSETGDVDAPVAGSSEHVDGLIIRNHN